jgi:DNA (cytosine-5)-methyltransferase 1
VSRPRFARIVARAAWEDAGGFFTGLREMLDPSVIRCDTTRPIVRCPDWEVRVSLDQPGNVVELFAGVGGFRLGLEGEPGTPDHGRDWRVVWSNQWEPSTKRQDASDCYVARFGSEGHSAVDIAKALDWRLDKKRASREELTTVPRLPKRMDLLVGGFPCQDYSVAKTLSQASGITGQKGVLWWEIRRFLARRQKGQFTERTVGRPKYVLLENVDRLLKSPASQRGRDFAIMLATMHLDGYDVQWRVIDASEYGFPQRRKRVFILAEKCHADERRSPKPLTPEQARVVMRETGTLARALPVDQETEEFRQVTEFVAPKAAGDLVRISEGFGSRTGRSPFQNAGVMKGGVVFTARVTADFEPEPGSRSTLGSVLLRPSEVPDGYFDEYYIPQSRHEDWDKLKGAKRIERVSRRFGEDHVYTYSEGAVTYPDDLDRASRTILTGEGGTTPSRFKHVVKTLERHPDRKLRRLTPIELERLQGFPDDWTRERADGTPITDGRRAFFMGNALVVGVVERIGKELAEDRRRNRHTFGLGKKR